MFMFCLVSVSYAHVRVAIGEVMSTLALSRNAFTVEEKELRGVKLSQQHCSVPVFFHTHTHTH